MPFFAPPPSQAARTPGVLFAAFVCTLLVTDAVGQPLQGGPGQLRPSGGSLAVAAMGELPTTDFGSQLVHTEHPRDVVLGVRTPVITGASGSSVGQSGFGGVTGNTTGVSALGAAKDAPSSIRVTGSQAADFLVNPAHCKYAISGGISSKSTSSFSCTVTFRASAEGARSALLEAMFPNGDRLQAVLKGSGKSGTVAMPAPGGVRSIGMRQ